MKPPRKGKVTKAAAAKREAAEKNLDKKLIKDNINLNVRLIEEATGVKIDPDELYRASKGAKRQHGVLPFENIPIQDLRKFKEIEEKFGEIKHRVDLILTLKRALELEEKK